MPTGIVDLLQFLLEEETEAFDGILCGQEGQRSVTQRLIYFPRGPQRELQERGSSDDTAHQDCP